MSLSRPWPTSRSALARWTLSLAVLAASSGEASAASHREAPRIALDPGADNTDVYAFTSPDDRNAVTFILAMYPYEEPAAGPVFHGFSDSAAYDILIDTDQNAREDVKIEVRFRSTIPSSVGSLLYGIPPITALDGPGSEGLGLRQSYTVTLARGRDGKFKKQDRVDLGLGTMFVVPPRIGGVTTPSYESLVQQGTYVLANGGRVFTGPRDDAFYADLGAIFDSVNLRRTPPVLTAAEDADDATNPFGVDSIAGFNVHAIAIELPKSALTDDPNAVIGVYGAVSRRQRLMIKGAPKLGKSDTREDLEKAAGAFAQVSRMGNPLVNELIVGAAEKDLYNATAPATDARRIGFFQSLFVVSLLADALGIDLPATERSDVVATYLKYRDQDPRVCTEDSPCADLLRLDLGVPPTTAGSRSRLGVLGGDPAGFPNGRRPWDDVPDIVIRQLAAGLAPGAGDGVNTNDVSLAETFPYLATPHESRDHAHQLCPTPGVPATTPSPAATASPTPLPSPSPTPTATATAPSTPTSAPTAGATPGGGALVCTGIHAVPDPDDPTSGHLFDSGECNMTMRELRFRITSGSTYTGFTVPMPTAGFGSTNQPNDTVIGLNPSPAIEKKQIAGAKFTTADANPHTIEVRVITFSGQTWQQTITLPTP
jgi:hypothetical protein